MKRIIESWTNSYFVEPVLFIVLWLAVLHSFSYRKEKGLRGFVYYLSFFLALFLLDYLYKWLVYPDYYRSHFLPFQRMGNYAVSIVELLSFYYFFRAISKLHFHRRIYDCLVSIFLVWSLYLPVHHLLFHISFVKCLHLQYVVEQVFLLLFCILYYLEFNDDFSFRKLRFGNEFWIAASLLLYSLITLPLTLLSNYLYSTDYNLYVNSFAFIDFCYILLILSITRVPGRVRYAPP